MKPVALLLLFSLLLSANLTHAAPAPNADPRAIPELLRPWQGWATWDQPDLVSPTVLREHAQRLPLWPGALTLAAEAKQGRFTFSGTVFYLTWLRLPGSVEAWPRHVLAAGVAVPVVPFNGYPAVRLGQGPFNLTGEFAWNEMPQRLTVPPQVGLLALTVLGQPRPDVTWDSEGVLYLQRAQVGPAEKDFLEVKVYRLLEDGIPLWLRTQVELSVAGKSREEDLRQILPAGWALAEVDSPLPVAITPDGHLKAQVRAGKWTVRLSAFHPTEVKTIGFAPGLAPTVGEELIGFKPAPELRLAAIEGLPAIDVSQTTFPAEWREFPVYQWTTTTPLTLTERLRGMGLEKIPGLTIRREFWLDDAGHGLVFRDRLAGGQQQTWRLDVAERQELGSVRSAGEGQLVTRNPQNGAAGVEVRARQLDLEATGRTEGVSGLSASGWRADADSLSATLTLPPGWRLLALFGVDYVHGDWLTAWTLLDLFLLTIFSLAVDRLWGRRAGLLAFVTFALTYQEPGAPVYLWLILLAPLALLRYFPAGKAPAGKARKSLVAIQYLVVGLLLCFLVPFVIGQVRQMLYPQLEKGGDQVEVFGKRGEPVPASASALNQETESQYSARGSAGFISGAMKSRQNSRQSQNLLNDAKAQIQTGPGVPEWRGRTIDFGWSGPVAAAQKIYPVLIPPWLHRLFCLLRALLPLALLALLVDAQRLRAVFAPRLPVKVLALLALFLALDAVPGARAQSVIPGNETLATLRERLLATPDAYPNTADIPHVTLTLRDRALTLVAEVQTAAFVAVPIPGRLIGWNPSRVFVDGQPVAALRREEGDLTVPLAPGVHQVQVEGQLAPGSEWQWTFTLRPHAVTIDAPGWNFTGLRPDGTPEEQIFFSRQQKATGIESAYDRPELRSALVLERHLELGLIWQVHNEVLRLSATGRAVSLRVPLLPGERVLTGGLTPRDGQIDVHLGAAQNSFTWESELTPTNALTLATRADAGWTERWYLVASPVWNVTLAGLPPIFEAGAADLMPVWYPWPGEKVDLTIARPEAIPGATVTVDRVTRTVAAGERQRSSTLELQVRCSLGQDFAIALPAAAEITSLCQNGQSVPVRREGGQVIVTLRPGPQAINVDWKTTEPLGFWSSLEAVRLPLESANITSTLTVPESRWILWTHGPRQGPAVLFWVLLLSALLAAYLLARLRGSPFTFLEWALLSLGLLQALPFAWIVVAWPFLLAWRGSESYARVRNNRVLFNLLQVVWAGWTFLLLLVLIGVVQEGFLGRPEMFIEGNGSGVGLLCWFEPHVAAALPPAGCFSVSIWWYRLLMLAWALWLSFAVLRWLGWAWRQFSAGGLLAPKPPRLPEVKKG